MVRNITLDVIARKHSEELDRLAAQFDHTADEMDKAGASAKRHTTVLETLDREIESQKTRVKQLGEEYNRTGSVDAFRNLRSAKRDLGEFERLSRDLGKVLPDSTSKSESGFRRLSNTVQSGLSDMTARIPVVGSALSKLFAAIPPEITIPVSVVVGGALLLTAGAATGGAIGAALGIGGIATGIALQLQDPQISSGVAALGARIKRVFVEDSFPFAAQVKSALGILNTELDRLDPKLNRIFANLATYVQPLAQGFAKAIDGIVSGVDRASGQLTPIINVVAQGAASIGRALGDALARIAAESKGGAEGLHVILGEIVKIIDFTGRAIAAFERWFAGMADFNAKLANWEASLTGWIPVIGDHMKKAAQDADNLANASGNAAQGGDDLKTSADNLFASFGKVSESVTKATSATVYWNQVIDQTLSKNMALDTSNLTAQLAVSSFADAVRGSSNAMAGNGTQALQLRQQLLGSIDSLARARDAQIAAGGSARDATDAYNREVDKLLALAKGAGLSKSELERLKGQYYVDVITTYKTRGTPPVSGGYSDITTGRIGGYADGGPVAGGVPILVGERGPEIYVPNSSGTIIPNGQAMGGGSPLGGRTYQITINVPPMANAADAGRATVEAIKAFERANGASWRG